MIVTRKSLSRRTILRGVGAALSLPMLDCMIPAFAASRLPGGNPLRAAWFYVPNGIDMRHWTPAERARSGSFRAFSRPSIQSGRIC